MFGGRAASAEQRYLSLALGVAVVLAACVSPSARPAPATTPTAAPAASTPLAAITVGPVDPSKVAFSMAGWQTDFTRRSVPYEEIVPGGPPRDGIPAIDRPKFEPVGQADGWLQPQDPVVHVELGGEARAYPLRILLRHEIVNDILGGVPVAVTYCPLCNSAVVFDRRLDGRVLDFGVTGNLRKSDLVMYDRQTESWWQQLGGEAIVGELTGSRLRLLPASIVSYADFRRAFPRGKVLSRDTGTHIAYDWNPYAGYEQLHRSPFLFEPAGEGHDRLPLMERVVAVELNGDEVVYPFGLLRARRVVADQVGGEPIVVFYRPGTASVLDKGDIAEAREVGAAAVYRSNVGGRPLTFRWWEEIDAFVDAETGSHWTLLGEATAGPLAGTRLEAIVHTPAFWFAWVMFRPGSRVAQ